jgi:hypothetical protein
MKEILTGLLYLLGFIAVLIGTLYFLGHAGRIIKNFFSCCSYTPPENFEDTCLRGVTSMLILL